MGRVFSFPPAVRCCLVKGTAAPGGFPRTSPSLLYADPTPRLASPLLRQSTYDKLLAEVPKYKMITVSILCDRLRLTCSLARKAIQILIAKGHIKPLTLHSKQQIYTRTTADGTD